LLLDLRFLHSMTPAGGPSLEYSVLVKRVVNFRIDKIHAPSQRTAIRRADAITFHQFIDRNIGIEVDENPGASPVILRYVEDGEESNCYLVDESGDEEFSRSCWYASDGVTSLDPGRICGECVRPATDSSGACTEWSAVRSANENFAGCGMKVP
jgi:hypothetical protein